MKHPQSEEWVPYVFGEPGPGARERLTEHLRGCAECRSTVARWETTLRRLDEWKLPPVPAARPLASWTKWAAAAALVLGLGFGLGRFTTPTLDLEKVRASLAPGLRQQLKQEVERDLRVELDQMESQRLADYVALKKDLDTVAVLTDVSFRDTQQRLVQLAELASPMTSTLQH